MSGQAGSWDVVERAGELARRGEEFALATVVWRQGPSSGPRGSHAIVTATGELEGWIGGACAEPVVIREAQRAIVDGEPRLLFLGTPEQFGHVPEGAEVIPIACQSEGAMQIFVEPVLASPRLVIIGRSPMVHTLGQLTHDLGWLADVIDAADFTRDAVDGRTAVIVATQGHGDEDAMLEAIAGEPLFLGLVASRRRAESVLGYLADRGVPRDQLERVHAPVGLDLGHTSHKEIAVAVLAELVKLRSAGALVPHASAGPAAATAPPATAIDPVCGMTVVVPNLAFDHDGVTYHFCGAGCRTAFEHDPGAHLAKEARC